jgi:hypothetical protein
MQVFANNLRSSEPSFYFSFIEDISRRAEGGQFAFGKKHIAFVARKPYNSGRSETSRPGSADQQS